MHSHKESSCLSTESTCKEVPVTEMDGWGIRDTLTPSEIPFVDLLVTVALCVLTASCEMRVVRTNMPINRPYEENRKSCM